VVIDESTPSKRSRRELLLDQASAWRSFALFYVGQDIGVTSIAPLYTRLYTKGVVLTPCSDWCGGARPWSCATSSGVERASNRGHRVLDRQPSTDPSIGAQGQVPACTSRDCVRRGESTRPSSTAPDRAAI